MSGPKAVPTILLVARREVRQRLRERAFAIGTAISLVIVALVAFLPSVLGGGPSTFAVGALGPQAERIAQGAGQAAPGLDARVRVEPVADRAQAERRVQDGDLDAVLLGGAEGRSGAAQILSKRDLDADLATLLQGSARQVRAGEVLQAQGLDPAQAREALQPPPLPVRALEPSESGSEGLALIASIFLYGQLITYGIYVAMGVVEEKASRIVEILLATIRPRELLAGKILGVGLVGLLQLVLIAAVGLIIGVASGSLDVGDAALKTVLAVLGFFVLGYGLYACVYAVAGSLVSRQEEVQSVTTPLTLALVVGFFLSIQALNDPGSTLATITSLVPVTAPLVMPARISLGEASAVEVVASVALTLAAIAVLVPLGGRIYAGAVLRTGGRIRLADAWRAARRPAAEARA